MSGGISRREFEKALGAFWVAGALPGGTAAAGEAFDVTRARRETPGCTRVAHFNNAGAALPPAPVIEAVQGHLQLEAEIGGYEAADQARPRRQATYAALARLMNCATDELALVENATRGWDMAFYSLRFRPGDRILTSMVDYASNFIACLQVAARTGAVVEVVPSDAHGQISLDALRASLARGRAALVSLTHIPTNGGLVNPAVEVGRLCREAGVPYLLDACQTAGQWPLDVEEIGCDMLAGTGRKFLRGPRGTGFLYVRRSMIDKLEPPLLDLHAARWVARDRYEIEATARRFENWEAYVAGQIGLGVAVEYALAWGIPAIKRRVVHLAERLRAGLAAVPGVTVRDLGQERCGIVTFTLDAVEPERVRDTLRARGVNVSVTSVSSTRLDMEARGLAAMVRASVHYYNTEDESDRLVAEIGRLRASG